MLEFLCIIGCCGSAGSRALGFNEAEAVTTEAVAHDQVTRLISSLLPALHVYTLPHIIAAAKLVLSSIPQPGMLTKCSTQVTSLLHFMVWYNAE